MARMTSELFRRPASRTIALSLALLAIACAGGCAKAASWSKRALFWRHDASNAPKEQPPSRPSWNVDPNARVLFAVFETSEGRIVCRLLPEYAPNTVKNFVDLAKGAKASLDPLASQWISRPFYDGLTIHRVVPGFLIQGGCPLGNGRGYPGFHIADEFHPALRHLRKGILGMATVWGQPNTAGSQFYITLAPAPQLDDHCPIFGYVFEGLDVLDRIGQTPTDAQGRPLHPIVIREVRVVEE
ncbi:MAG: peptidylprolyl isomerase [Candidatus Sumerlaeota bacterium]|nr:peptidylprolyl isomerase [Candidatus Sumerlaeota bacterium]